MVIRRRKASAPRRSRRSMVCVSTQRTARRHLASCWNENHKSRGSSFGTRSRRPDSRIPLRPSDVATSSRRTNTLALHRARSSRRRHDRHADAGRRILDGLLRRRSHRIARSVSDRPGRFLWVVDGRLHHVRVAAPVSRACARRDSLQHKGGLRIHRKRSAVGMPWQPARRRAALVRSPMHCCPNCSRGQRRNVNRESRVRCGR